MVGIPVRAWRLTVLLIHLGFHINIINIFIPPFASQVKKAAGDLIVICCLYLRRNFILPILFPIWQVLFPEKLSPH